MPVQYPPQLLFDDILAWYQVTARRTVSWTLAYRPLFELPSNLIIFAANIYALSLIPQLLYAIMMDRCVWAGGRVLGLMIGQVMEILWLFVARWCMRVASTL